MIRSNVQMIHEIENAHTSGAYSKRPLTVVRGLGSRVWDADGNSYLDMTDGLGPALLGHCHPAIVEAISQQAGTLITCPEIFYNDQRAEFYNLLASALPGDLARFFLCNSGTEAIEGALKVARLQTGRSGLVAAKRGFHGRTLGALGLTWNPKYRETFQEWTPRDVRHVPFNDLQAATEAVDNTVAAVVVEVVQGEGGVYPADDGYLRGLRQLCDARGALLIVDEIQTGLGRTGRWLACEHDDVLPDIVTLAKGIAGGLPMGVVAWRESLGPLPMGSHGSTFGGNPLSCAAAIATLKVIQQDDLAQRAAQLGDWFMHALQDLDARQIRAVRARGLMVGVELRGRVTPVLKSLQERGVLALPAGKHVLRFLPPLNVAQEDLEQVVNRLAEALDD